MSKVISKDGTEIAYQTTGSGPAVILVNGAMGFRALGYDQPVADLLAPHFTVYTYDRRGRGESTNTKPFSVEREVEDIDALIQQAGGSAFVYGISSGACLSLEAALKLGEEKIKKLALYEPPYDSNSSALQPWKEYRLTLSKLIAADHRGDAVELFMRFVGAPEAAIGGMREAPVWSLFEAAAPTLEYDAAEMGEDRTVPVERAASISTPTLIMDGGANLEMMPFMHATAAALAKAIPHAQHRTLDGQTHDVNPNTISPVLVEFFSQ